MSDDLHVNEVALHYDVPHASVVDRLDGSVRRGLSQCGSHVQPPSDLPPNAVVAVQSLAIAVDVEGQPTDAQLARGFGQAFTESLTRVLRGTPPGMPTDASEPRRAVWFAEPHDAELAWVMSQQDPEFRDAWWWPHLIDRAWLAEPAECVLSWSDRAPTRWRASLWELVAHPSRTSILPLRVARDLVRSLTRPLSVERRGQGAQHPSRDVERQGRAAQDAPVESELVAARSAWMRLAPQHRSMLLDSGGPWRELLAYLLYAAVFPAVREWSPRKTRALLVVARQHTVDSELTSARPGVRPSGDDPVADASAPPARAADASVFDSLAPATDPSDVDASDAPATPAPVALGSQPAAEPATHRVCAGGLLFLIRRLDWSELPDDPVALHHRLDALGLSLLQRLLSPLPSAARRAALQAEAPTLAVFAGGLPDPDLAARAWQPLPDEQLADVLAELPELDDHPRRRQHLSLPAAQSPLDQSLQRLLVRPGRLELTATHAELVLAMSTVDFALRVHGWDFDPGWTPQLGRVIRFRYEEHTP